MKVDDRNRAELRRVAATIAKAGTAFRRVAPDTARDCRIAAAVLKAIVTSPAFPDLASMLSGSPELPKNAGMVRAERQAAVRGWMADRVTNWPIDKPPPTMADDIRDAKKELKGIPEQMIEDARWPGWKRAPGRPQKIR